MIDYLELSDRAANHVEVSLHLLPFLHLLRRDPSSDCTSWIIIIIAPASCQPFACAWILVATTEACVSSSTS